MDYHIEDSSVIIYNVRKNSKQIRSHRLSLRAMELSTQHAYFTAISQITEKLFKAIDNPAKGICEYNY